MVGGSNFDSREQARFDQQASTWWDPEGPSRPLHDLNPARLKYITDRCQLRMARVLDIGCGGGILAESLAAAGARVTAIDVAPSLLTVAKLHGVQSGLQVDYQFATAESIAEIKAGEFDVVTCMEMLEHVPDPESVIRAVGALLRPGGNAFFSTLNRTPLSMLLGIVGAEYLTSLLPRGTHRFERFIRPSELACAIRSAGLSLRDLRGLHYDPISRSTRLGGNVKTNYLIHAQRKAW